MILALACAARAQLQVRDLECEGRVDPMGIEAPQPNLGWMVFAPEKAHNQRQSAYEIQVATSPSLLAKGQPDIWDSRRVASDKTFGIEYTGPALSLPAQQVFWRVRVWDGAGRPSLWSDRATWTSGADWGPNTHWIKSAHAAQSLTMRGDFTLAKVPKRALLYVCGLGQYELFVNGLRWGQDVLAPGWTNYRKTCLYDTCDVASLLRKGKNTIALLLGNGMYHVEAGRYTKFVGSFGDLKAIAQLDLPGQRFGSGPAWRVQPGPITYSHVYGGEDYDARLLPKGWNTAQFDDSGWPHAQVCAGPGGALKGADNAAPPVRTYNELTPVSRREISANVTVYDLGQNTSLMPFLSVSGLAGSVVRIIPAELVKLDGTVDRSSMGGGMAYCQYTLDGTGQQTYFPHFFYSGARYLQVERRAPSGQPLPVVNEIRGVVVHSSAEEVGEFACSSDLFNRIHKLVVWAQRSNMVSVLTDCPHRERLGWLEQTHLNGPSLRYNFDLATLFGKIENDIADSQLKDGFVAAIAPEYVVFGNGPDDKSNPFRNSPEWGSAFLLVPWQQYEFTGDDSLLSDHYAQMKGYVAYLDSQAKDGILDYGLGDWYDIGPNPPGFSQLTPRALTATAFYYQDVRILQDTARLRGLPEWRTWQRKAAEIRDRFNARFYDAGLKHYAGDSQCGNALALVMGLAPEGDRNAILQAIVDDIQKRGLTAGDVGYRYLLRALADGGRSDVIFAMNNQSAKPGYGYQLAHGATSLTEAWDAGRSSSQNHFMLGQIEEWFYHDLAGIQNMPGTAGFKSIAIRPAFVEGLQWARARYRSQRGWIVSSWRRSARGVRVEFEVPVNTRATLFLPRGYHFAGGSSSQLQVGSGHTVVLATDK